MRERATSNADTVFEQKRRAFKSIVHPRNGNPQEQFFIENEVRQLWTPSDITALFPSLSPSQRQNVFRDYPIILSILAYIDWTFDEKTFKLEILEHPYILDDSLPFENVNLSFLRPLDTPFLEKQLMFKPCEIKTRANMKIMSYQPARPWPFLDKEIIATGSFSTVWKANVAPGYYSSAADQSNDKPTAVAYKILRKARDYKRELGNLEYLRESMSGHKHICLHIAAIIRGLDFYVFFHWTPYGDLETLLNGGKARSDDTRSKWVWKYDFHEHFGNPQKSEYVQQLTNIASAIHHLHDNLELATTRESFYCAHLDLKPHNILIYPDPEKESQVGGIGLWMISDFGISSFKMDSAASGQEISQKPQQLHFQTIGDIASDFSQKPAGSFYEDSNSVALEDREGACVAPELHEMSDLPRNLVKKCDIWSLGCIAAEVFAFMIGLMWAADAHEAAHEVGSFRRRRWSNAADYSFFDHGEARRKSIPIVRTSVADYLQEQKEQAIRDKRHESKWISAYIDLLRDILVIDPSKRPEAFEIERRLESVRQLMPYEEDSDQPSTPTGSGSRYQSPYNGNYEMGSQNSGYHFDGEFLSGNHTPRATSPSLLSVSPGMSPSFFDEPTPHDSISSRDRPISSRGSSITPPSASDLTPEVSYPSETPRFSSQRTAPRPRIENMSLLKGFNKKCIATALSPLGDTAAWLLPNRTPMDKPTLRVYNISYLRQKGIIPLTTNLPTIQGVQWEGADTRLMIASSYVSIVVMTKSRTMTGLFFDAHTNQFLVCPWKLPSDLVEIIPSRNGIFAIRQGGSNKIILWNSMTEGASGAGAEVSNKDLEILKCAFNSDGTRFFVWSRKRGDQNAGRLVTYAILSYDLRTFPKLTAPLFYTFKKAMAMREFRSLLPLQGSAACLYTQGPEQNLLWATPEGGSEGQVACSVSDSIPGLRSYHVQIACSTDWFISVRPKGVLSGFELHETAFRVSKSGKLDIIRDRKLMDLSSSDCWIAASSVEGQQNITIINSAGKIDKITVDWSAKAAKALSRGS